MTSEINHIIDRYVFQILCITKENYKRAVYELLRQNQSVLLLSKKKEFICHYARLLWKDLLSG